MKKKKSLFLLITIVLILVSIWLLGKLFQPKYMNGVLEGAMTQEYYYETTSHDVIFIGDCEVYENFSPAAMWNECGVTSYIRGSAQQLIWQSYWLLEETFSIESPRVVVYNVQAMKYDTPQSEAYNRMCLDGMRLSTYKINAIIASMTEDEELITYMVPLLRYHSRWNELTAEDFQYIFSRNPVTISGYLMRTDVKPMKRLPSSSILSDYSIGERCWEYLDKIRLLCENNDAQLILIKSSSIWPTWYDEWENQIVSYAEKYNVPYINFLKVEEEIGIDWTTDTYDAGLHLNLYGAEKASRYFAHILQDEYGVPSHKGDAEIAAVWQEKVNSYNNLIDAQLKELEEYGYLKSWTLGE